MKINEISGKECKRARSLWQEVFNEDSKQFTDYYFEHKAEKNKGYVIGQAPYDAMMFRTPYHLQIGKEQREISYLVGVATRKECRHRGYMRKLLMHSFREMYQEKQPFAFLMPANPAIYEPFDFRYIYEREEWELKDMIKSSPLPESITGRNELEGLFGVREIKAQIPELPIMEMLAEFANNCLKNAYHIYVHRDSAYYEMQLKESIAQNGDIYVLLKQGEVQAFFLYAEENGEIYIQEVIEKEEGLLSFLQKKEKKKPIIMARIIHLEEMMKLVCSEKHRILTIEIEDELIPENAGVYRWEITPNGSKVIRQFFAGEVTAAEKAGHKKVAMQETIESVRMHIGELAPLLLKGVFINEIV